MSEYPLVFALSQSIASLASVGLGVTPEMISQFPSSVKYTSTSFLKDTQFVPLNFGMLLKSESTDVVVMVMKIFQRIGGERKGVVG